MISSILQMVLPVLCVIVLGWLCRRQAWLTPQGLQGIKSVVGNITLPTVLFNAFLTASYTAATLITFLCVFLALCLALAIGFWLRRMNPKYAKFMPFMLTGFEGGMLGYSLFGLLYGTSQTHVFATADMGQTFFVFTLFLCTLQIVSGQKPSAKAVAKAVFTNPATVAMLAGILLGLFGVGTWLMESAGSSIYQSFISFLTAPTAVLILLVVGYELSFDRTLLKPVLTTVVLRIALMATLCCACALVVFAFTPFDKQLLVGLMLGFSLPAPFIVPLYADVTGHGEYISTTLSVSTLLAVVLFVGIAAYSLA